MEGPKSESLAALHSKNRHIPETSVTCAILHTAMFGTVEAKMSGMMDVYKYFTRTIAAKDDLFADTMKCLDCQGADRAAHPDSVRKVAITGGTQFLFASGCAPVGIESPASVSPVLAGQVIVPQGDPRECAYFIQDGEKETRVAAPGKDNFVKLPSVWPAAKESVLQTVRARAKQVAARTVSDPPADRKSSQ